MYWYECDFEGQAISSLVVRLCRGTKKIYDETSWKKRESREIKNYTENSSIDLITEKH